MDSLIVDIGISGGRILKDFPWQELQKRVEDAIKEIAKDYNFGDCYAEFTFGFKGEK